MWGGESLGFVSQDFFSSWGNGWRGAPVMYLPLICVGESSASWSRFLLKVSGPLFSHHLLVVSVACRIFRYHLLLHVCSGEKGCGWKAVPWSCSAGAAVRPIGLEPAPAASELVRECCAVARSLHVSLGQWVAISISRPIKQRNHLPKEVLGSPHWRCHLKTP